MTYENALQKNLFAPDDAESFAAGCDWHEQIRARLGVQSGSAWPDRFGHALRSWFSEQQHKAVRVLSLFSGGGGFDIAFHDAGFEIVEMVEIEKQFADTLRANFQTGTRLGGKILCTDIRDYNPPADLEIDFIIGGPPCQTFSAAGRRALGVKGTSDARGTLFEEYVRLLNRVQPVGFLFENVYGITGAEGGKPWQEIQQAFQEAGYQIYSRVLDAADYGVPQHRERLFIVGLRNGTKIQYHFPYPTHGPDALVPCPFYSAGEAVCGVNFTDEESLLMQGRWGHLIANIPPGLNYSYYTKEMGHPTPIFAWRAKFSDFMYKADSTVPVRTIKAQGGAYTGPFSWENRHFSTAEMKRLQTFPDDYAISGKRQTQIHQIGNSVPPQIGRILALSILHQVFGVALPFPIRGMPASHELGFRTRKRALTNTYALKARAAIAQIVQPESKTPAALLSTKAAGHLTSDFALVLDDTDTTTETDGLNVRLHYEQTGDHLTLCGEAAGQQTERRALHYTISLQSKATSPWPIPLRSVALCGVGGELFLFTALWKAFEAYVNTHYGIDDLVQLSGYYQYAPNLYANMEIKSKEPISPLWDVLRLVVGGVGVATPLPILAFAQQWGISETDTLTVLHQLKKGGYEVRSHNTNPQMTPGEFLLPYAFPTLTPRSIQRRKKL